MLYIWDSPDRTYGPPQWIESWRWDYDRTQAQRAGQPFKTRATWRCVEPPEVTLAEIYAVDDTGLFWLADYIGRTACTFRSDPDILRQILRAGSIVEAYLHEFDYLNAKYRGVDPLADRDEADETMLRALAAYAEVHGQASGGAPEVARFFLIVAGVVGWFLQQQEGRRHHRWWRSEERERGAARDAEAALVAARKAEITTKATNQRAQFKDTQSRIAALAVRV